MLRSLALVTALAALTAPALAEDCAGSHAVDRCLVGTWTMTKNGMDEWTKKHLRNFHATVKASNNTVTLNADGTFSTGASHVEAHGTATGGATTSSTLDAQASGHWSAADGKFNMCAAQSSMQGSTTITTGPGKSVTSPIQHAVPSTSSQSYSCAGSTFTTTMQLRGDDVTSTYTKVK